MTKWSLVHPEPARGLQSATELKNAKKLIGGASLAADYGSQSGENPILDKMKNKYLSRISISYFMTKWFLVHPKPARGLQSATVPKIAQNLIGGASLEADSGSQSAENAKLDKMKNN